MKIKNFKNLALTETRKAVLEIIEVGLQAIDTKTAIRNNVRLTQDELFICEASFSLKKIKNIFVVGIGKCALDAAFSLAELLGNLITKGVILDIRKKRLKKIQSYVGTHPFPSNKNVRATKAIIDLLKKADKEDLVICIVSGGGSTLLCQPKDFSYKDEVELLKCLFYAGANIQDINTIRKHISLARGGFLAKYAYPAQLISLIFSDVPGDALNFISSSPTVKDQTTIQDALKVIEKYNIQKCMDFPKENFIETPKEAQYFQNVKNNLIVSNKIALEAMREKAEDFGFSARIMTAELSGEVHNVSKKILEDLVQSNSKTILLYGGETTVAVKGKGKGGRNQELGLSSLEFIKPNQLIATVASDGRDNTNFAGVLCDAFTLQKMKKLKLNPRAYLDKNNAYQFFSKIGDFLLTGNTGSNVSDLIIAVNE